MQGNRLIGLVSMKNPAIEEPMPGQTHEIGTIAKIDRVLQTKGDSIQVIVQGLERFRIEYWLTDKPYLRAHIQPAPDIELPEEARKEAQREWKRLKNMSPHSPECSVIKTYLDWILELPWKTLSEDQTDSGLNVLGFRRLSFDLPVYF